MPQCCWSQTSERLQLSWQPEETRSLSSCGKGRPTRPAHFPQPEHGMAGEDLPSLELKCVEDLYFVFARGLPQQFLFYQPMSETGSAWLHAAALVQAFVEHVIFPISRGLSAAHQSSSLVSLEDKNMPEMQCLQARGTTASSKVAVLLQGWSAHKQFTDGIGFRRLVLLHIHHITLLQPWVSLSLAKPPKQQKEQVNSLCLSDGPEERHRENSTCSHGWVENRNVWWRYLALKITPLSLC